MATIAESKGGSNGAVSESIRPKDSPRLRTSARSESVPATAVAGEEAAVIAWRCAVAQ